MLFTAYHQLQPYRTPAAAVRSTDIIRTPHAARHEALEVNIVHLETFTNPEGRTLRVVRYTGWELFDGERSRRVTRGWGQVDGDNVIVIGSTRQHPVHLLDAVAAERVYNVAVRGLFGGTVAGHRSYL